MRGMGNVEEYLLLKMGKNFLSKTTEEVVFWAAEWQNFIWEKSGEVPLLKKTVISKRERGNLLKMDNVQLEEFF